MPQPKPKDGEMSPNEWGKLRSYMAQQGIKQAQIREAIGDQLQGRKTSEVCDALRAWLKTRPKAE